MNRRCIFTICAKNYIGLARILGGSVRRHCSDIDYYILVADELDFDAGEDVLEAKSTLGIDPALWTNMAFKYNLTEFCTCIKPFSVEYLMNVKGYEEVCYMDPDTFLFSSMKPVFDSLDTYMVVTAPHILLPDYPYTGDLPDKSFLFNGINNFGFVGMRRCEKVLSVLKWWEDRLCKQCFGEMLNALCTDQKWGDFFQAFFTGDELLVSKDLGLNLAPWNYFERKVTRTSDGYVVSSRQGRDAGEYKLVFCHFAGYNYRQFAQEGKIDNGSRARIGNLRDYEDIAPLVQEYVAGVYEGREEFLEHLGRKYSYAAFDNDVPIDKMHRRLYNGMVENFGFSGDPFRTGDGSFYSMLREKGLFEKNPSCSVDSLSEKNLDSYDRKLGRLFRLLRFFRKIVGYRNYVLLLQFARRISLYDLNTFLLGKEYENYKLR